MASSSDANVHPKVDVQAASAIDAWHHSDFLCRNYVLNGLSDSLYNVYSEKNTAKEHERKYKTEDAGVKKFMVGRFLDYKMVDSRPVIKQVLEIQVILHEIHVEGMNLGETFQVAAIIEKLPPSWNDFKNYLKHKQKEMNVEELHGKDKKKHNSFVKNRSLNPKGGISKKFTGKCFNCNGMGHRSSDCKKPRRVREANLTQGLSDMDLCAMISEVNLVGSNPRELWVDTGATRHVCSNKEVFSSLEEVKNGESCSWGILPLLTYKVKEKWC
ncbi:uncharacterized protein LOC124924182 [Impatiens glandulifera]|uniref:uncharacterized protein LOC124924182 n=1 Tax=Impatiens glandulifera TaxID=253017 RepID=UPI001FB0F466|nr:uncharacterized protein LOC124924182 [Impatiens glandulifera]